MVDIKHLKNIISHTLSSKKKKENQHEESTIICPSSIISNDDSNNSLSSTLFLPEEDTLSIISNHEPNVYSNLYQKLPNGNWLVSYRTRDEKLIDGMQHVRILNLFISSILPSIKVQRKSTHCISCGQLWTSRYYYSSQLAEVTTTKKYANINPNSRPAEPSIAIYKLSNLGRPNEALEIYLKLLQEEGFPSQEALYQLIRALYKSNNLLGMYAVHDTLISYYRQKPPSKRSQRPMIYLYTMLINLIANHTKPIDINAITSLCKELNQFQTGSHIVLYNTLIKGLLQHKQFDSAKAMLDELLKNTQPNRVTFGILIHDASRRRDINTLLNYLDDMEKYHITPDYPIVSMVVNTLCDLRQYDKAKEVVEKLYKISDLVRPKFRAQLLSSIQRKKNRFNKK